MVPAVRKSGMTRKLVLSAAAAATVLGAASPAFAGGRHHGHGKHYSGHYHGGHHYRPHRHRHHGHGGGGKAAAIALGVIGGAIIIDAIAEDRARDRYERDRYYRDRYADDRYRARYPAPYYEDDRYDPGPRDGSLSDDDLDGRLDGGGSDGGPEPIRYSADAAYKACIIHARAALSERGFQLASPAEPETAEEVGGAWRMTANVTTSRGVDMWTRAMYCEADEGRVYELELL